ncbi:MAG: 1-deoxy-D-xylulose-5-phosphate reductoisomerase [Bacillota bacterium]|nr:1-deoxy-D-xylulose-5-phosphate reductoisomerase [Bacillota bacterium]
MKRIAIMGSTGSIGEQTLEVIDALGSGYKVVALTANKNETRLAEQIKKFEPEFAALNDRDAASRLVKLIDSGKCRIGSGPEGQEEAAVWPGADLIVMAQVGFSGFKPLLSALKLGKTVALSNKESIVCGGEILKREGLLSLEKIYPVDSEHSAIWQCMGRRPISEVSKIYLTASGGPFFGRPGSELESITPDDALKHPNWQMGSKITIDSATLMNKGLEVIEAKWLFGIDLEKIEVVIHRQSIVHSMVEYIDGSILAQLGMPDMRLPIQYALTFPERRDTVFKRFDPVGKAMAFEKPDRNAFPCLDLAYEAARTGGTLPTVLNGANEIAVENFLKEKIKFTDIPKVISLTMQEHDSVLKPESEDIYRADSWSRKKAYEIISKLSGRNE